MADLQIVRRIRGNVHGTIEVTQLEDQVIAHPYVQRLRRIKQLAFLSYVFPGASHARFEHSLGVMQLAANGWHKLHANQKRMALNCSKYEGFAEKERRGSNGMVHGLLAPTFEVMDDVFSSAYTLQALRLAGLMHDLGHPPFSHSGERFLPSWKYLLNESKGLAPYLVEYLHKRCDAMSAKGKDPYKTPVRHEVFTLLLIDRCLNDVYQEYGTTDLSVTPRDVLSIITPEIAPTGGSVLHKQGVHKLCNELISGEFDLDRMDYLARDSRECGVVYGIFDSTRILDSLAVYHDPLDGCLHVAITFSGLAAFEDYLRARYSMYLQLYFHKTGVAAEAMLQNLAKRLGGWHLPAGVDEYAAIDEHNIDSHLNAAAEKILGQGEERVAFQRNLDNLLKHRRLWKRVYETTGRDAPPSQEVIDQATAMIEQAGYEVENISSSNSLTNFRPRRENEVSRNYLRLIKKDERQFPRVVPIEDHSSLIDANDRSFITRLYVEDQVDASGERVPSKLKKTLQEKLGM